MQRLIRLRRKSAVTNYKKRIAMLKSGLSRVVIRKSNRGITMQVVAYEPDGDKVTASADSRELKSMGWEPRGNIPTAYLTGLLLAKKASSMKGMDMILDIGIYRPVKGSVIFAAAKGAQDGGLKVAGQIEIDEKRLSGAHIAEFSAKKDSQSKSQFTAYAEAKFDATKIVERFDSVKKQLMSK
ncbi:MAG: 50S ribosomal protein L18 [Candidatus Micrarchaeota archaeon]|nr:50S ribosomal protein L18 [Candidatus Micrarchaeota archaeon]